LSSWSRERLRPLPTNSVKLAAERYDPNDGLVRESPRLEPQTVRLKPSPSPEYLSDSTSSSEPRSCSPKTKGRKRPKAQASQGDAVLVGFMGGLNHPDLATRAGEEPLPQSDDSDLDEPMAVAVEARMTDRHVDPVHLAGNALFLVESKDGRSERLRELPRNDHSRPELPKLLTEDTLQASRENSDASNVYSQTVQKDVHHIEEPSETGASRAVTDGPSLLALHNSRSKASPSRNRSPGDKGEDSAAISPVLRRYTIPTSLRSPAETLPAMQCSPPSTSSKQPNGLQDLPSLHDSGLKPLLSGGPHGQNGSHGVTQPSISLGSPSVQSPPMSAIAPRPATFPSPRPRTSGSFSRAFPHGQPSPAYSDTSPRESTNMSPPGRPSLSYPQFFPKSSQGEALTPQSAESLASSSTFSTAPSPDINSLPEQMEIDRTGRILPPLVPHPGPPLMTGSFKCDYVGCNAAPFQTQYLLKYVSHIEVAHETSNPCL